MSGDRAAQLRALSAVQPWGTTGLYDAIVASIDAIQSAKGRRALVLLSDGTDRYSQASASDALDRARKSDVMIYPVAVGGARPPLARQLDCSLDTPYSQSDLSARRATCCRAKVR